MTVVLMRTKKNMTKSSNSQESSFDNAGHLLVLVMVTNEKFSWKILRKLPIFADFGYGVTEKRGKYRKKYRKKRKVQKNIVTEYGIDEKIGKLGKNIEFGINEKIGKLQKI